MAQIIKHKGDMIVDQEQKKHLLDLFNAGREVFDDFNINYVSASDLQTLDDLIDDMKEVFGIVPTNSTHRDDNGKLMPSHWSDHVWSDDPRAYKQRK
jgi:hypothetical protein|tara:strand:- start:177 stop:467 length:291 start_codon:yes stop_codon:yes gene_type:complete